MNVLMRFDKSSFTVTNGNRTVFSAMPRCLNTSLIPAGFPCSNIISTAYDVSGQALNFNGSTSTNIVGDGKSTGDIVLFNGAYVGTKIVGFYTLTLIGNI